MFFFFGFFVRKIKKNHFLGNEKKIKIIRYHLCFFANQIDSGVATTKIQIVMHRAATLSTIRFFLVGDNKNKKIKKKNQKIF